MAAQIATELRQSIRTGRLAPGTRLPATRDLAADLAVSRGVVVEAYEQLVAEGFLLSRVGKGTHVAPLATAPPAPGADDGAPPPASGTAPRLTQGDPPAPRLTQGDPPAPRLPRGDPPAPRDGGPPDPVCAPDYGQRATSPDLGGFPRERWLASVKHVLTTLPASALDYPDPGGVPELREELAAYLRRVRAADVRPENLIIVGGVALGLSLVLHVLGAVTLAVEDPTSQRQLPLLRRAGARLVAVPADEEGLNVEELAKSDARAVLVTPAHQYPTGVVLSPPRRAALIEWGGTVLEDDYDAEFRFDRDPVGCLQGLAPDRVVLVGSVSKSMAPGLRLGWVVAPDGMADAVRQARGELDLGSPVIEQYALAHFLRTGGYDRHLRKMRREYRRRRDALVRAIGEHLPEITVRGIDAGLHIYLDLPADWDEPAVVAAAQELGVAAEPVGPMRFAPGPPAVVVGFARLPAHRAADAVQRLKVRMSGQRID